MSLPGDQSFAITQGDDTKAWVFVRRGRLVTVVEYSGPTSEEYQEELRAVAARAAEKLSASNVS